MRHAPRRSPHLPQPTALPLVEYRGDVQAGIVLLFFNLAGAAVGFFFSLLGSVSYAPSLPLRAVLLRGGVVCRSQVACAANLT